MDDATSSAGTCQRSRSDGPLPAGRPSHPHRAPRVPAPGDASDATTDRWAEAAVWMLTPLLVALVVAWAPTVVRDAPSADPQVLVVAAAATVAAVLLAWHLLWLVAAHLAMAPALPAVARRALTWLVARAGTSHARRILGRGAATAALGTSLLVGGVPGAFAAVVAPADGAAGGGPVAATHVVRTAPGPSAGDSSDVPPDDLSWGAPSGATPAPSRTDSPDTSGGPASTVRPPSSAAPAPSTGTTAATATTAATRTPARHSPGANPATRTSTPTQPPPTPTRAGPAGAGPAVTGQTGGDRVRPPLLAATTGPPLFALPRTTPAGSGTPAARPAAAAATDPGTHPGTATHVVRPGESLWSIAADALGPGAEDADIARAWPRIHALNVGLIGPDPDLIHPGQTLDLPGGLR